MRTRACLRLPVLLVAAAGTTALAVPGSAAAAPTLARHSIAAAAPPSAKPCDPLASSLRPLGPPRVAPGSFMEQIRDRGHLVAGVDQNTYPFSFLNPLDGKIEGFDVDIVRAVAAAIFGNPNKVVFKAISDAQRIPAVRSGAVDIVAHTMTITCWRLGRVDFSTVYFEAGQRVLVLKNSPYKSLTDLFGKKVCATSGSDSINRIKAAVLPKPVAVTSWTDCLMLLQQDDVAAISTDDAILHGFVAQDPWTKIVGQRFSFEPYGLAISNLHPDFVRFVNAVLQRLRSDGQWAADYRRWIGHSVPAPPRAQYKA
jgi:polar amino acid transport system substrate-binding protein